MLIDHDPKIDLLSRTSLFHDLSRRALRRLAGMLDVLTVPAGAELTHEGALAREFIVVADGDAGVERGGKQIATIGPGEILGEMAFFGDGRRTATVRARTPMKLFVGNPRSFRSMLTNPTLAGRVQAVVDARSGTVRES